MTWARFDDRFWSNRKVIRAWKRSRASVGLYAMAVTYCSQHATDGLVDVEWVEDRLPTAGERQRVIEVLLDVGLFDSDGADYRVHDYLEFNPSRADTEERRQRDAERKARGRASVVRNVSARTDNGRAVESSRALPQPVPSRPVPIPPSPPSGGRRRDLQRFEGAQAGYRAEVKTFAAEHFPDAHPDAVLNTLVMLRRRGVEPTVELVREQLEAA